MVTSLWQKQNIYFYPVIWAVSAVTATLLLVILLMLGWGLDMASVLFIVIFAILRVTLAFTFRNRFTNSMVRVLKFDYEELERDFRMVFKNKFIRFHRKSEEDAYSYDFPGHSLSMTVQPYWLTYDMNAPPATKLTLKTLTEKNKEFAEMLAVSIDEMVAQRAHNVEKNS